MPKSSCLFLLIIYLFFQSFAQAQNEKTVIALKQILEQISAQHDVKFNFIEDEILIFAIAPPPVSWELQDKMAYITKQTKLKFSVINKTYYTLYNDQKVDKPLCGFLIDSETKSPIENATVSIVASNTSTATDENGYFELPVKSPNPIEFKHQSYQLKRVDAVTLYIDTCPKIFLIPFAQELSEVVTQQYLTTGIFKKKDGTLQIKPKKFGILPGLIEPDVLQTLQQIPGISSVDETISNINVRGGTHDQNLFLWNGIRMFQTGHFFGLISAFNPSIAHTISIAKNGCSAFFGESVSSVVDISTHAKTIEQDQSSISSNLISSEFYSKIKVSPQANIEISGRRSLTDFFSSTTYQNYRNRVFQNTIITDLQTNTISPIRSEEHFYFYDLSLQYLQKIGTKHELSVDAVTFRNKLDISQASDNRQKDSALSQQNIGGALHWQTVWNANNTSQINISASYYNLDANRESIQTNQIFNQQNTVLDFGFQLKNAHQWSKTIILNTGYQLDEIGVTNSDQINTPEFSRNIKEVSLSHAGIVEMNYTAINLKTSLTAGCRLNYFEKYHRTIAEPRIQFHQTLATQWSFEILGEQKSQTMSQIIDLQQDFLGIEKRRWTLANETTIPIQTSNQLSLGFTFKSANWLVTWDNFYKRIAGISSSSQGFQNQFEFVKANGSYEVLGSEILVQRHFKKCYAWLSYSHNDNTYAFKSMHATDFSNNFELKQVLAAAFIYDWNSFKIALGGKWHSGKPTTAPRSTVIGFNDASQPTIVYGEPNADRTPDYLQLNFSAAKDWKVNQKIILETSISILNVLNKDNIIHQYYRINANQDGIERINTYSLQRTPNINLKLHF